VSAFLIEAGSSIQAEIFGAPFGEVMSIQRQCGLTLLTLLLLATQQVESSGASKTTTYVGTIGKSLKIEMRLTEEPIMQTNNGETYQSGIRYTGTYSYVNQSKPIKVSGVYNAMGTGGAVEHPYIDLHEKTDGEWTGDFYGTFSNRGVYSGTWTSAYGKRKHRFVLYPKRGK
jgi:hypothetical protein